MAAELARASRNALSPRSEKSGLFDAVSPGRLGSVERGVDALEGGVEVVGDAGDTKGDAGDFEAGDGFAGAFAGYLRRSACCTIWLGSAKNSKCMVSSILA